MGKSSSINKIFWRNTLTRAILVIASVAIIVFFLPRNSGPKFRYDVGKPWMYSSLIAQFDFPIYKTDEAVKFEQDSIRNKFEPYYNFNPNVKNEQIAKFLEDFKEGIPGLPPIYISIISECLSELYQAGIMSTMDYSLVSKDTTNLIRVIFDKKVTGVEVGKIYSTLTAYEQLFLDQRISSQRQVLQKCDLNEYLQPNLTYDKERSQTELTDLLSSIPLASGMVLRGQKIIDRGEIVDDYIYRELNSFEKENERRSATVSTIPSTIAGQVLYVGIIVFLLTTYLGLFRRNFFEKIRGILMLYAFVIFFPVVVSLMIENNVLNVYVLPFAITPIFVRVFMDSRTAFISHVAIVLICAAAVKYQYEFIIVQIVAGLIAIYTLQELSQRAQLFKTAVAVALGYCAIYFALQLMQDNSVLTMDRGMYKYFIINGILLLFAYPLMLIVEQTFGFVSQVTLIELSNTSKELLRHLSEEAPGTFQHSVMVGNLAAEIANKIGANAQLVRTGALYHDIGKMKDAPYYTENQSGVNPLDRMELIDAAQVVINHITEGLKLAEKYNLPSVIKDFIKTHHGTGKTKYFYITYKNEHPDEPIDESVFTYPGPDPSTREQAILMMADSVEAASRSLPEYTEESISGLINRIIDGQVSDGFFRDCPITFHDIRVAKQVLLERLKSIYHTRVSYPELKGAQSKK